MTAPNMDPRLQNLQQHLTAQGVQLQNPGVTVSELKQQLSSAEEALAELDRVTEAQIKQINAIRDEKAQPVEELIQELRQEIRRLEKPSKSKNKKSKNTPRGSFGSLFGGIHS